MLLMMINDSKNDIIRMYLLGVVGDIFGGVACDHTPGCVVEDVEDAGLWLLTALPQL